MIVDTSAIMAVVNTEPGWQQIVDTLESTPEPRMSAMTYVELFAVVDAQLTVTGRRRVETLLAHWGVVIESVDKKQAHVARTAYADFGKGSGHRARLNLGDVFSYALAVVSDEPLLYVGENFAATDVASAL